MGIFHFLNAKQGDCSIIQHPSGNVTVVDVCNARLGDEMDREVRLRKSMAEAFGAPGNFGQKDFPVNPITYMRAHGITDVFRFIVTHPDMDHLDGLADLFSAYPPTNLWDTANQCEKDFEEGSPYREEDWLLYKRLRDSNPQASPKRLTLYSGQRGQYYNEGETPGSGGDGLHVLAPTTTLIADAITCDDYNDASYAILYKSNAGRILLAGDSHDNTWEHILAHHRRDVENVEVLVAPHHGRKSGRSYEFLDVVRPQLTLFGNANSAHLAYGAWHYRGLPVITNNQADCVVIDTDGPQMQVYATHLPYARSVNQRTYFSERHRAFYLGALASPARQAA